MDTIFSELHVHAQQEESQSYPNIFYKKVVQDYEKRGLWRTMYTYRTRLIPVDTGAEHREEFGFACATKQRKDDRDRIEIHYISDVYNLNTAMDIPTAGTTSARFIFHCVSHRCELEAIAEEPARAFANVDYSIEEIYLKMRKFYNVGEPI